MNAALGLAVVSAGLWLRLRLRDRKSAQIVTWDCGYARPSARMGYTASSFAAILVGLFGWLLRPRAQNATGRELFARSRTFHSFVPEQILDRVLVPIWDGVGQILTPLRAVQRGRIQQYLLYILVTLALLLVGLMPIREIAARLVGW